MGQLLQRGIFVAHGHDAERHNGKAPDYVFVDGETLFRHDIGKTHLVQNCRMGGRNRGGCMNEVKHHFSAGVYAKEQTLKAGYQVQTHAHKYDHLSIMSGGPVVVDCDGEKTEYTGHACITIKAGIEHTITAMGDSVWYCIHATEITDPEQVDATLIVEA